MWIEGVLISNIWTLDFKVLFKMLCIIYNWRRSTVESNDLLHASLPPDNFRGKYGSWKVVMKYTTLPYLSLPINSLIYLSLLLLFIFFGLLLTGLAILVCSYVYGLVGLFLFCFHDWICVNLKENACCCKILFFLSFHTRVWNMKQLSGHRTNNLFIFINPDAIEFNNGVVEIYCSWDIL